VLIFGVGLMWIISLFLSTPDTYDTSGWCLYSNLVNPIYYNLDTGKELYNIGRLIQGNRLEHVASVPLLYNSRRCTCYTDTLASALEQIGVYTTLWR